MSYWSCKKSVSFDFVQTNLCFRVALSHWKTGDYVAECPVKPWEPGGELAIQSQPSLLSRQQIDTFVSQSAACQSVKQDAINLLDKLRTVSLVQKVNKNWSLQAHLFLSTQEIEVKRHDFFKNLIQAYNISLYTTCQYSLSCLTPISNT